MHITVGIIVVDGKCCEYYANGVPVVKVGKVRDAGTALPIKNRSVASARYRRCRLSGFACRVLNLCRFELKDRHVAGKCEGHIV